MVVLHFFWVKISEKKKPVVKATDGRKEEKTRTKTKKNKCSVESHSHLENTTHYVFKLIFDLENGSRSSKLGVNV